MSQVSLDLSGIANAQPGVPEPISTALSALQTAHNDTDTKLTNTATGHDHDGTDSKTLSTLAMAGTLLRAALYTQYDTTNALTTNQMIYRGWGVTGDFSATSGSEVVTLPNSGFDDTNYSVQINYVGEKATLPASITDVNVFANGVACGEGAARTTTAFTASFFRSPGGNFRFVVYTWIAIGTKAP